MIVLFIDFYCGTLWEALAVQRRIMILFLFFLHIGAWCTTLFSDVSVSQAVDAEYKFWGGALILSAYIRPLNIQECI